MRFPEFSGEWERKALSEFVDRVTRRNKGLKSTRPLTISAQFGLVDQTEFFKKSVAGADLSNYYLLSKGEFAYNKSYSDGYPLGAIKRLDRYDSGVLSSLYICFVPKPYMSSDYLVQYFESTKWNQVVKDISGEGARNHGLLNVPVTGFFETQHFIPKRDEQEKLGAFLTLIEKRIATQSKIIEELTTLRSALYDSMFCSPEQEMPKFRIQLFSGKWQLCQLNEICSRKSIKNKDNLYSRVLTIAAQHGLVDQESFFKKRIASENLESYLCLEKGDFAYNKSYSSDYPWGAVKRLSNFDKGIISPLYICFTPKPEVVDPDYLAHYFESTKWHSGISEISGEGARNHGLLNMSVIDYCNTCHRIPGLDEQKAIARRLNAIAHKLQTEQEYLELLNRQKDCFLKQMFI